MLTGMQVSPPFRADHVGSLLRPDTLMKARSRYFDGTCSFEELKEIEDREITGAIDSQQKLGLPVVTDGEFRRSFWHYDFMGMLEGFELVERDKGVAFKGAELRPIFPTITGELGFPDDHPMLDHFRFLRERARAVPKISIPGPSCCHFRTAPADIAPRAYRDLDILFDDIAKTYARAVKAFYDAGCRYLQLDDIFFTYLCDPAHRADKRAMGQDPDWLIDRYAWMLRTAICGRPGDMVIGMHLCRGNFRSTYAAQGSYDRVADAILTRTGVDIFFMEYDTERAGGLAPIRMLPKGNQRIMLGFVTTKSGELESRGSLRRRIDAASEYADIEQLGLAPQCGFASTEEGNLLTQDEQWQKLELVVEVATEIWGGPN